MKATIKGFAERWVFSACLTERSQELIPETRGSQTKLAIRRDHPRRRIKMLFYRAMLCMRGTSHGPMCVSVFVTSRSTKTAKHRITKTNHMIAQGV